MPTRNRQDTGRQRRSHLTTWRSELDSAVLYRALAELERGPKEAELFRRLAEVEAPHAERSAARLDEPRLLSYRRGARACSPGSPSASTPPWSCRTRRGSSGSRPTTTSKKGGITLAEDELGNAVLLRRIGHAEPPRRP